MSEATKETPEFKKRLTESQWEQITTLAEFGELNLREIAAKYGVSPAAISQYFKRKGIVMGSRKGEIGEKVAEKVKEAAVAEAVKFADQRRARIEETKTDHYNWTTSIAKATMMEIVTARKAGAAISTVEANIRTLKAAASILAIVRTERYELLDVEVDLDPEALPQIQVRDLSAEEIAELRNKDEEDDGLADIETSEDDEIVVEDDE